MPTELQLGELVAFRAGERSGTVGVVSLPITERSSGHVLTLQSGHLLGVIAEIEDVELADEASEGFARLAYNLIKLGSRVIEQRLLVYRH
jgi:hypothetical protein